MKKQSSLILVTILGLLAIFANISTAAEESESDYSKIQTESSEDTGATPTSTTYLSDDEEEETPSTVSLEEDTSSINSTDSDI